MAFSDVQDTYNFYLSLTLITLAVIWKILAMKAERITPIIGIAVALQGAIHGNLYYRELIPWEKLLKTANNSSLQTIQLQFLAINVLFCCHDFKMVLFFMFPLQCISTTL